jgi:hypothetical protein
MLSSTLLEETKQCSRCAKILPSEAFHKNSYNKSGLRSSCKICEIDKDRNYRLKHRRTADYILKSILADAKKRAKKQGVPFSLTLEHLNSLIVSHCPITLAPIDWTKAEVVDGHAGNNSPSLDKIIPELGYIEGNCAIISHRGNRIKSNGTIDEHRRIIKYMAEQQLKHIDF